MYQHTFIKCNHNMLIIEETDTESGNGSRESIYRIYGNFVLLIHFLCKSKIALRNEIH